jgi:hypothetical protein
MKTNSKLNGKQNQVNKKIKPIYIPKYLKE